MKEKFGMTGAAEIKKKSILESLENQLLLAKKLETVYDQRPKLGDFVGAMKNTKSESKYTKEAIEDDEKYVEEKRKQIEEANSSLGRENLDNKEIGFQLSEMMQAMIVDRMNKNWFKDCKAIMTSDFDDLKAGIDAVLKHENGGYLGAAFDFTVTNKREIIDNKLETEWERHVEKGQIPTVKYFEDPDTKEKKNLLVPRFIVGASKDDVEELAEAYLTNNAEVLENHPFKYVMLLQIEEQLQTILDYYETNTDTRFSFAKDKYEKIQTLIRGMKKEIHADEKWMWICMNMQKPMFLSIGCDDSGLYEKRLLLEWKIRQLSRSSCN